MRGVLAIAVAALAAGPATADVVVNCDRGQSLGQILSILPKVVPLTVVVKGTCNEYVEVKGFEGLTLRSTTGATLIQPQWSPTLPQAVLTIAASRSVTIDGLRVNAPTAWGVNVRSGSTDVRLRNLTVESGDAQFTIWGRSEVSMARVTAQGGGWACVGVWDASDVHIEDSLLENSTPGNWKIGIAVGGAVVALHGTTIRNMWEGMGGYEGAVIKIANWDEYYPMDGPAEVVIENPAPEVLSLYGMTLRAGASASLTSKLRIVTPGESWGGDNCGVLVDGASTLTGGGNLEIQNSQGHGVLVMNNSSANLAGANITGTLHSGVVAVNHSTVTLGPVSNGPPTTITGSSGADVFCDETSLITGKADAVFASVQCNHVLDAAFPAVP